MASLPLSPSELQARVDAVAKVGLAHLPTPLHPLERLSRALGGPTIYIKRDDMTGLAFGGNKTRQLEHVFAEILAQGADTVVAGAYTQSNWCRQAAAAARRLGLSASLVLVHGAKGPLLQGNLLLDHLLGAEVEIVEIDHMQDLGPYLEATVKRLEGEGRKPFLIDPFDLDILSLSAVSYVDAFLEIDQQMAALGAEADHVYLAGTMMTPAGLHLGARALGRRTRVVAINPSRWDEDRAIAIARIATACAERLGLDIAVAPEEVLSDPNYVGENYGVVTEQSREAFRLVAESEGIILDPVYTSKAMAGLIDHIRQGRIGGHESVVFVHTGGMPAVFAYGDDLLTTQA